MFLQLDDKKIGPVDTAFVKYDVGPTAAKARFSEVDIRIEAAEMLVNLDRQMVRKIPLGLCSVRREANTSTRDIGNRARK
jgi:hypothetical protein